MARVVWYPPSGDWCENLVATEGYWTKGVGNETISRDLLIKAFGEASIKVDGQYNYYLDAIWQFNDTFEFNGNLPNAKIYFLHALDEHFKGSCEIWVVDDMGGVASKDFGTNPSQQIQFWEHSIALGSMAGWQDHGVNWAKIKRVRIICDQNYAEGGKFWLDKFHFEYDELPTSLAIDSQTVDGKNITQTAILTSPTGYRETIALPFGPRGVTPNGIWIVDAPSPKFVRWENGDVQHQRSLELTGTPVNVIAYFSADNGGNGNGGNGSNLWWLGLVAGVSLIGVVIYSLKGKKKS